MKSFIRRMICRVLYSGEGGRPAADHLSNGTLSMGEYSYGIPKVIKHRGDSGQIIIGKFCSIAADVTIFTGGNHPTWWISSYPFRARWDLPGKFQDGHPCSKGDVIIGSDVWIGRGATIMSGVTIGHGSIIAAQAVVTKPIPPYMIVGGNPARNIRLRFTEEQVSCLLDISWWDWPFEKIYAAVNLLNSENIQEFIETFGSDHKTKTGDD